jgi:DNA-3-methyladenine glycosylase II
MRVIRSIADIEEGVAALIALEPRFGAIVREGLPPLRRSPGGFATLVEIIVEQMISLRAGQAIMGRLRGAFMALEAEAVCRSSVEHLMSLGLSRVKARSILAIAEMTRRGELSFDELDGTDDSRAKERLMRLPSVGPWSADIYLLSALGRQDVWPAGDVALQSAAQLLFHLRKRPDMRRMERLAEPWRPWRAVAARLLWTHYRRVRSITQE